MRQRKDSLRKIVDRVGDKHAAQVIGNQINVKLSQDEKLKLEQIQRQTGLNGQNIIRKFITDGEVTVRYDTKKVIKTLGDTHTKINNYSLKVNDDIADLREMFSQIKNNIDNDDKKVMLSALVINAEFLTQQILNKYIDVRETAEKEMGKIVDIHSGK
jgi:hypothetical protein